MKKKSQLDISNNLISGGILPEIKACRPLRLFINKQKKKGNETNPFALRSKFLQLSIEKQTKYFQKAIDKYIQLLDEKNINENVQIEGKLFENLLSKGEQRKYFESINAPTKPMNTTAAYYAEIKKQENDKNPKAWKLLSADEKKPYIQMLNDAKNEYSIQTKNFAENLPERLKLEYLSFINQTRHASHVNDNNDENTNSALIRQRRKSIQSLPENFQLTINDNQQKLTRIQLDELHKCKPDVLYYEKKISNDEKPTFVNSTAKNTYIRSLFNQLNEKKRHKFILKSTKKWQEYLELNSTIIEYQIPTLHLLLGKNDDIHYYFSSLDLPIRPPVSALHLYNNERQQKDLQQYWTDLSQTTKDEYIKRLSKLKHEYYQKFIDFIEKTLPSDYIRLEFFRNIKYAAKDYDIAIKDQVNEKDNGQLKITQYLVQKQKLETNAINEFDRIKRELLSTDLTSEQKKLVERLGQMMNKYIDETTASKRSASKSKSSTNVTEPNNDQNTTSSSSKHQSTNSDDVVIINGDISSSDNIEHQEQVVHKKKKKHKRNRSEIEEIHTTNDKNDKEKQTLSSPPTKKRK
ncbi:unnamed protein product [Rotaria sordida]|uniref:HMG box domain-containing protein n=1 Tax=Rotaria sordida TaxID=392033 RepID=A0A815E8C5_9BILA|nr:unnamed protein product [Rotaria sordida]